MRTFLRCFALIALLIAFTACDSTNQNYRAAVRATPTSAATATRTPASGPCATTIGPTPPPPQQAEPPVPFSGAQEPILRGIAMVSASEGWAVGGLLNPNAGTGSQSTGSLLLHYTGGKWTQVPSPTTQLLNGIQMLSVNEGWAVGEGGVILHYQNGQWMVATIIKKSSPFGSPLGIDINAISMLSASEGWAVGRDGLTAHYSGGKWTLVDQGNAHYSFFGVSMISADEGWARGWYYKGEAVMFAHYQSGTWTDMSNLGQQNLPSSPDLGPPQGISMVSANEGWAAGRGIWHYCDGEWSQAVSVEELGGTLETLSMLSPSEGWAVGFVIWHYSKGQWSAVKSPVPLDAPAEATAPYHYAFLTGISMLSSDEGWAIGNGANVASGPHPLTGYFFLHYQHGAWSLYTG